MHGIDFAIPFRSNIKHPHAFWTNKAEKCGLDYSKTIVIEDTKYIDASGSPRIRELERKELFGKERIIGNELLYYDISVSGQCLLQNASRYHKL